MLALVGCLAGLLTPGASAAPGGKVVLGLSLADQETSFSQEIKRGAEDAGREWGFTVEVRNAAGQAATQQADLAALIKEGVTALLVQPVDPAAVVPALAAAAKVGPPVVTLVTPVAGGGSALHVNTNYRAAGRLAAEHLKALLSGGTVLVLGPADPPMADKAGGFETALKNTHLKVVRATAASRTQAAEAVEAFAKTAGGPPAGVFTGTPETALGALRGLNALEGGAAVPVVGYGTNPEAGKALKLGRLAALVEDKPWDIGHLGAEGALGLLKGKRPAAPVLPADPLLVIP